jgi:HlyD family secretion protein
VARYPILFKKIKMKKQLFLALPLMGALCACSPSSPSTPAKTPSTPAVLSVELVTPTSKSLAQEIRASGRIQPWQEVKISAEISGMLVKSVNVDVGQAVKKGQVLARLATEKEVLARQQLKAQLDSEALSAAQARADWTRAKEAVSLAESNVVLSAQELQKLETAYHTAVARVAASEAALSSQDLRIRQATIVAPDDGVVSARSITAGQLAQAGAEYFRVIRQNRYEWYAEVSAETLAGLDLGATASVALPQGVTVAGKLVRVAPSVSATSDTGIAYVELPASSALKSGMLATGVIAQGSHKGLIVPSTAIVVKDGQYFAITVSDQNVASRVGVTARVRNDGNFEVLKGLTEADRIVASGSAFLDSGDKVQVVKGANK